MLAEIRNNEICLKYYSKIGLSSTFHLQGATITQQNSGKKAVINDLFINHSTVCPEISRGGGWVKALFPHTCLRLSS